MTFLDLCQRVLQESGLSGSGPSAVTGQRGIEARIVNWVRDAWVNLQGEREDWQFMFKRIPYNLSPGKTEYSLVEMSIADLARWDFSTATIFETAEGPKVTRQLHSNIDYDTWLVSMGMGQAVTSGKVGQVMTIPGTNNTLMFWPTPEEESTVGLSYYRSPVRLMADGDVPDIWPEDLQMVIAWRALIDYGFFDGAAEIESRAREKYDELMQRIDSRKKPTMAVAGRPVA